MNYKEVIESRYNRQNWQLLLHDIFGNKIKFWNTPSNVPTSSQFAKQALWLGTITLSDEQTISVYEVELSDSVDIERNRRGIRDMLLTAWRGNGNAGAFMFCYRKNESVLRFSYVSESWNFAEDGTYKKESTDTKRFTYLLGEGHRCRTAQQQFEKLRDSALSLKDLTKAFSVDAVSDMFFKGYKQQYEDIIFYVTGKRMVKVANKWEERQEGKPCAYIMQQFSRFSNPEKAVRDYVKKLMGRLVFLQFLQKKGWLGVPANEPWGNGDAEFIQHLFEQCKDKDHFVDNVLESVFNDLNTERKDDIATRNVQCSMLNVQCKIPYLNGGLFEREAADEAEFPLPAKYMKDMLDFFSSYNFTIDENDPDDAEVGVDPEMLGRIFENLLEDNKDKGAFYTPKEIVTYMCRESLIAYLQTDIEDEATKEAIRQFVTTHDSSVLGTKASSLWGRLEGALRDVKICDPAIGSGAFPMGLLKELFLCRTALEGIEQSKAAEIKKHIIQQNIYGVDIERGAVDIARLRFWLSLIVDEETPQALPNLDFKIMQGNSLLEQYKGVDLSNITELKQDKVGIYQTTMFDDMLDVLRLDLRKKLDEYYNCPDHKRKAILKQDIINNVKQQLKEQSINVDFGNLDLSGNDQFMLWHTWFYDVFSKGGFDIVIGNPPYLSFYSRQAVKIDDALLETLKKSSSFVKNKKAKGRFHSVQFFLDKGITLSSSTGYCSYIIDISFFEKPFRDLREYLLENYHIKEIVSDLVAFENVASGQIILSIDHDKCDKSTWRLDINGKPIVVSNTLWVKDPEKEIMLPRNNDLIKKIETKARVLSELGDVRTGVNIGGVKDFFLTDDSSFYPYISGGDNVRLYEIIYPTKLQLKKRETHFIFDKNVEKEIWDKHIGTPSIGENNSRFIRPKIIIRQGDVRITAALDIDKNFHCGYSLFTFNEFNDDIKFLKFILGVLNSTLITYYMREKKWIKIAPGKNPQIRVEHVKKIPICLNEHSKDHIVNIVDQIIITRLKAPSSDTLFLESEINRLVYQLYGLTDDEINIVEGNR